MCKSRGGPRSGGVPGPGLGGPRSRFGGVPGPGPGGGGSQS